MFVVRPMRMGKMPMLLTPILSILPFPVTNHFLHAFARPASSFVQTRSLSDFGQESAVGKYG
jgi:hypothetical protein